MDMKKQNGRRHEMSQLSNSIYPTKQLNGRKIDTETEYSYICLLKEEIIKRQMQKSLEIIK